MRKLKTLLQILASRLSWRFSNPATFTLKGNLNKVLVIANGPSLSDTSLDGLEDTVKVGMNRIYLSDRTDLKVDVLVVINELIVEQYIDELLNLDIPIVTKWRFRSYFPKETRNIFYVSPSFPGLSLSWPNSVLMGHTVTNVALQLALGSGARGIYIVGMDHNFSTSRLDRNRTEIREEEIDRNHFLPNYFPKGSKWETPDLLSSELEYQAIDKFAKKNGVKIWDSTIGGKCQVFDKLEWEKAKSELLNNQLNEN